MKKLICALLAAILMISFAACAGKTPADTAPASSGDSPFADTTVNGGNTGDAGVSAEIDTDPPEQYNFGGEKIKILYWEDVENPEFFVEDETGEAVNDAIYRRNINVSENLNVEFEFVGTKGSWSYSQDYLNAVANSVNGDDPYSILATYSLSAGICAYNGLCGNMRNLPELKFEKDWWPDSLLETATVNGKLYFVSGDVSSNLLYMMYAMYYNKDMVADLKIADPYSFVEKGEWTLDKMIELSTGVYSDEDGDSKISSGDRFGQAIYALHMDAFLTGSGILCADIKDGKLVLDDDFTGAKCEALTDKIYAYAHSKDAEIISGYKTIFSEGRSLFITDRSDIAIFDLKDKRCEIGILPIPKYDTDQEDYLTVIGNPFTLYCIPVNAPDPSMSAAVLEALARVSYEKVTPAIFELSLKTRYADGGNDVESYDILRRGIVYDLGRIYAKVFDGNGKSPGTLYSDQVKSHSLGWATAIKASLRSLDKSLEALNAALEKMS